MTIKETAGKILLYLYQLQRTVPAEMRTRQLGFIDRKDGRMGLTSDKKWFAKDLMDINNTIPDVLNAFGFLLDKNLIQSNEKVSNGARIYVGVRVTAAGIDMIEGVEYNQKGRDAFGAAFNMKVSDGTTIEKLVRDHLGRLLED